MKKKFSVAGLVFLAICTIAATIQWYSQQPATTALTDSMVIAVERPVPHGYLSTTLASLKGYTGTNTVLVSSNVYTTNLYTTNLYSSNIFTTNLFSTNVYTTNLYSSNAFITNITVNNITSQTNYFTDLTVESNVTFNGKVTINNITVTNGITNLNLTANTIVKADANNALASVPNGSGALTNDGSGNFGWSALSSGGDQVWTNDGSFITPLTNLSVTVNSLISSNPIQSFLGGDTTMVSIGEYSGYQSAGQSDAVMIGQYAGYQAWSSPDAIMIGYYAGNIGTNIDESTLIGRSAGEGANEVQTSQGIGGAALKNALTTYNSIFIGQSSGEGSKDNLSSVFIGDYSGYGSSNANYTVAFGNYAGSGMGNIAKSIFIGPKSGTNRQNTLWIDSQATSANGAYRPLIYGEFDNRLLAVNGTIAVSNSMVSLERVWSGPTNEIAVGEWTYTANTPCAVTNIVEYAAGYGNSVLLSITNASSSNITFTVHSPIRIPYGETSRSYTITNGNVFFGSFRKGAHGSVFVPRGFYNP